MKLIRCYIENFGKLHQFTLHFNENITVINEENGFGKTTLAAFIKAMLYGFPKAGKSLEKNDRKRYLPWQGGIYGGYLEFEHNGISYRIERTFGITPNLDRFRLFQLEPFGVSTDFTENIGFELLGVSPESYEKTSYLPQIRWNSESTTKELKDKLSNIIENSSDIGSYEKTIKTLRNKRNELLSYRGKDGALYKLTSEISAVETLMHHAERSNYQLSETQKELALCESQLEQLKQEQTSLNENKVLQKSNATQKIISEQYDMLNAQINDVQAELHDIASNYSFGLPSDEELRLCSNLIFQTDSASDSLDCSEEKDELSQFFSNGFPDKTTMEEYENMAEELCQLNSSFDVLHREHNVTKPSMLPPILCSFVALLLSAVAHYFYRQYQSANIWIALSAVLCCFVICLFILLFKYRRNHKLFISRQHTLLRYKKRIEESEQMLRDEMYHFGLTEDDPVDSLKILKMKRNQYIQLLSAEKKRITNNSLTKVRAILDKYKLFGLPETQQTCNLLISEKNRMKQLLAKKNTLQTQKDALKHKYAMHVSNGTNHKDNVSQTESELLLQIESLQKKIISFHREIALLQKEADSLIPLEDNLNALLTQRAEAAKQVELLDKTIKHLQSAYETLSAGFIAPLKERFSTYLFDLMSVPAEHIFIDKNVSVSFEHSGVQRSQSYFSVGELDMIALCIRLALIDLLYPNQKPLLILDDPFVNLDQKNINTCLNALEKISKTHQILYLTCHESRI